MDSSLGRTRASYWWITLLQGIFAIVIGMLLITNPAATTVVIVQFIGIYWLISGVFSLVGLFLDRSLWGLKLLIGILGIMAGLAVLQHPLWSAIMLPTILVVFIAWDGIFMGIFNLVAAFRGGGLGAAILGVLNLLIGILLLSAPMAAALAVPWVFGVLAVAGGVGAVIAAIRQRS